MAHTDSDRNLVEDTRQMLRDSFERALPDLLVAIRQGEKYRNIIDRGSWQSLSEVMIPNAQIAVDQALAEAVHFLLPDNEKWFSLLPETGRLDITTVDTVERRLHHVLRDKMDIRMRAMETLKDCFKFGKGYGVVEPKVITPMQRTNIIAFDEEEDINIPELEIGTTQIVESYRYIPFGAIIPTPDGGNIDNVSGLFWLDLVTEASFEDWYKNREITGEKLMGDSEQIIKRSRSFTRNGHIHDVELLLAEISGIRINRRSLAFTTSRLPAMVPILKCFFRHREYWLANGETLIFDEQDSIHVFRKSVVAATYSPDADLWYTPGIIGKSEDLIDAVNTMTNSMLDLFNLHLAPPKIINDQVVKNPENVRYEPWAEVHISEGKPDEAISFQTPPRVDPGLFAMTGDLQQQLNDATGQLPISRGGAQAGNLRGGSGAFETQLQTASGRQKLANLIIELGWLKPTIENTLLLDQILVGEEGAQFIELDQSQFTGDKQDQQFAVRHVTRDDLRNVFAVKMNLREKMKNSAAEGAKRAAIYDRLAQNPNVDQAELITYLVNDEDLAIRLTSNVDPEANLRLMQGGGEAAGLTQGQQAVAGGAAQAAGVAV